MENIYVKNSEGSQKIYLKIAPLVQPHGEVTYEGTELATHDGQWQADTYGLTYHDLRRMYEEGFHTIEPEEFESVAHYVQSPESAG